MGRQNHDQLLSRRGVLASAAVAGVALGTKEATAEEGKLPPRRVQYSLNMSTVRGQKLSLPDQVDLAAKAGYDAVEPWIGELRQYEQGGGNISDLRKRIADRGLKVPSAIGFAEWLVDDEQRRAAGMEQAKKDMELIRSIGGTHIAAPPAGATKEPSVNLLQAAARYRTLLDLGVGMGVIPQLEVWGFSVTLSKLGETMLVAT